MVTSRPFEEIKVGDFITFSRTYDHDDFVAFSAISGDKNPLHCDAEYATCNGYEQPIVPLHLAAAPLSAIAGMGLPGRSSLYLSHRLRAIAPLHFGRKITYSAKVQRVDTRARALEISAIAIQDGTVALHAEMLVQSRDDVIEPLSQTFTPRHRHDGAEVLITGASGGIGRAAANALSARGWDLVLVGRSRERLEPVEKRARSQGVNVTVLIADLAEASDLTRCASEVADRAGVIAFVHAASAPVHATHALLTQTNGIALNRLIEASLPAMLSRQTGYIINIGSAAQITHPIGWEDYIQAKSAAASVIDRIGHQFGTFGVTAATVAPGFVETDFSADFRTPDDETIQPEDVADCILSTIENPTSVDTACFIRLGPDGARRGHFGWAPAGGRIMDAPIDDLSEQAAKPAHLALPQQAPTVSSNEAIAREFAGFLGIADRDTLNGAELGVTPGWDSLRHIELLLHLERKFDIRFDAGEMDRTRTYEAFSDLVASKLGGNPTYVGTEKD